MKRLVFTSGKVYYELAAKRKELDAENDIAVVRVEQVSPDPWRWLVVTLRLTSEPSCSIRSLRRCSPSTLVEADHDDGSLLPSRACGRQYFERRIKWHNILFKTRRLRRFHSTSSCGSCGGILMRRSCGPRCAVGA